MSNIKQLKKQLVKLQNEKKEKEKPYYLIYAAEYGKIKRIGIRLTEKDIYKELQKGTEEFLKWQRYILSDETKRAAVEGNEDIFTVMFNDKTVSFLNENQIED